MHALGGGGWLWGWKNNLPPRKGDRRRRRRPDSSKSSGSAAEAAGGSGYQFPLRQAAAAGSLVLAGDTIAQLTERWRRFKAANQNSSPSDSDNTSQPQDVMQILLSDHDWIRALRMASYGFFLYGPGSYAWYQYLDHTLADPTVRNLVLKVILNQIVLGPCVIAVVFAWNHLWQGKLAQLPNKYQKDALPTLLYGFRFWIPVSVLNFWAIPLQARVAFMSMCSIFWNFCLSSVLSK